MDLLYLCTRFASGDQNHGYLLGFFFFNSTKQALSNLIAWLFYSHLFNHCSLFGYVRCTFGLYYLSQIKILCLTRCMNAFTTCISYKWVQLGLVKLLEKLA